MRSLVLVGLLGLAACSFEAAELRARADASAPAAVADAGPPGTRDANAPATPRCVIEAVSEGLEVRAAASLDAEIVARLPAGTRVEAIGAALAEWQRIARGPIEGWADRAFLSTCGPPDPDMMMLLPWPAGEAYRVEQGHGHGSHVASGTWAWDFATPDGTPLLAAHAGTVRAVRFDSRDGACESAAASEANYVVVDRGDGFETLYLHLAATESPPVAVGEEIERGQLIGFSGQTGWSCGPHVHFQLQRSPSGGGDSDWYNASVPGVFWDTGEAWDPPEGVEPVSANRLR